MALKSKVTAPATATARRAVAPRPVSRRVVQVQAAKDYGRVFNFSAGPAILPVDVLEKAQADLVNWQGSGMSIMEMSHRGKEFESVIQKAEADLRALLNIPSNYKVSHRVASCFFLLTRNYIREGRATWPLAVNTGCCAAWKGARGTIGSSTGLKGVSRPPSGPLAASPYLTCKRFPVDSPRPIPSL